MIWSLLHLPMPAILETSVNNLGKTATPLGLMAMGGALKFGKAFARPKPLIACTFLKLAGYEAVFLPIAVMLGFSHDMLVAIIIMLGSATTVSCYIMAKNMNYDGAFTSGVVMTTTLFSSFTMTIWLYICRSLGLIYSQASFFIAFIFFSTLFHSLPLSDNIRNDFYPAHISPRYSRPFRIP